MLSRKLDKKLLGAIIMVAIALFSIVVVPMLTPQQVIAQPKVDCTKAVATPELKYCSQQSYKAADAKLNQAYRKVLSTSRGEARQLLITAQTAWIKFRDNNCNFEVYSSRGGTGYEIFRNGCLEKLTNERTKGLENYLSSR
jgi:uncharacterized protein YecT (DUF1311 family)